MRARTYQSSSTGRRQHTPPAHDGARELTGAFVHIRTFAFCAAQLHQYRPTGHLPVRNRSTDTGWVSYLGGGFLVHCCCCCCCCCLTLTLVKHLPSRVRGHHICMTAPAFLVFLACLFYCPISYYRLVSCTACIVRSIVFELFGSSAPALRHHWALEAMIDYCCASLRRLRC